MKTLFKSKIFKTIATLSGVVFPTFVFAQFSLGNSIFRGVVFEFISILQILIPIMVAVAFIVFFWGVSKFILNSSKPDDIKNGKNYMMWAIIALFVLVSFRGIIALLVGEFGFTTSSVGGVLLPETP